jgi:hypothetical protein
MGLLGVMVVVGVRKSWRYRPYVDEHFGAYARRFEEARAGELVRIPINPVGWEMELRKR